MGAWSRAEPRANGKVRGGELRAAVLLSTPSFLLKGA